MYIWKPPISFNKYPNSDLNDVILAIKYDNGQYIVNLKGNLKNLVMFAFREARQIFDIAYKVSVNMNGFVIEMRPNGLGSKFVSFTNTLKKPSFRL